MKSLVGIQEWLLRAIQHPAGASDAKSMVRSTHGPLTPVDRLEIYGRSFHGRLLQVLEGEYAALRHAMEPDLFHQFASEYLRVHPPSTYTLNDLGKKFPQYLRDTRPHDPTELWPEFLINLATLERTFSEVYNADGPENHKLVPATDTEEIAKEPWTRILPCQFPVHDYFLAFKNGPASAEVPAPRETTLLVYRRNYRVMIRSFAPA
jgi:hypothetical protein